jgi:hypothetical protein
MAASVSDDVARNLKEHEQYAHLNQLIYDEDPSNWRPHLDKMGWHDWEIDKSISKNNMAALVNHKLKKTLTVHSGTNLQKRKAEDLTSDFFVATDLIGISPRYKDALKRQKNVMTNYSGYEHATTGFSLGGAIANQLAHEVKIDSHAFNPGVAPNVFVRRAKEGKERIFRRPQFAENGRHKIYITKGDWISHSGTIGIQGDEKIHFNNSKENAKSAAGKAHSLCNWLPYEC